MKRLEIEQMEVISANGWGSVACKIGFGAAGALLGGPWGLVAGGIAGNMLCISHPAY